MVRFMIVVFGFLGFAFYEMSGGAEFDPEATRLSRIDAPTDVAEEKPGIAVASANAAPARTPTPINTDNVTRVSLNLASLEDVARPQRTLRTQPIKPAHKVAARAPAQDEVSEEEPTIILPSLIVDNATITPVRFGDDAEPTPAVTGTAARDLRTVTGSRVNVRGGPGTEYSVVNSLKQGDEVIILQDPGNGWVKLRPAGGGTVGWMADFLLSEG